MGEQLGDAEADEGRDDAWVERIGQPLELPRARRLGAAVRKLVADEEIVPGWCPAGQPESSAGLKPAQERFSLTITSPTTSA